MFLENQSAAACATYQDTAPLHSIFFNSGNGQHNATQLQIQSLAWKMCKSLPPNLRNLQENSDTDLCTLKKALNNYFVPLTPSHPPKLLELISFYVDRVALPLKNNPEFAKKFNDNFQKIKSMELAVSSTLQSLFKACPPAIRKRGQVLRPELLSILQTLPSTC